MKKVLIAEDHPGIAETYKLILESEGYEVIHSCNGEDCINRFDEEFFQRNVENHSQPEFGQLSGIGPFELVVLDYHMPRKDGIDVAEHILSMAPYQRILIASSYPQDIIKKCAEKLNRHVELLLKPFDLLEFADAVEKRIMLPFIGSTHRILTRESRCAILETQLKG